MLHPMWVKLPNCYLSRPTCAPLNERALWNRWNSPSLGSMEPWGVSDSEQKISATHCSKNSPFSGEVVSTHTLLPNVLNLALNRNALLWCNQTKGSINFYSYLLWDTILFGVCVTFDAYWLWDLMMRFPPQIRLCRLNCHSWIVCLLTPLNLRVLLLHEWVSMWEICPTTIMKSQIKPWFFGLMNLCLYSSFSVQLVIHINVFTRHQSLEGFLVENNVWY